MCKVINSIPWQHFYVHIKEVFLLMLSSSVWDFSNKSFIATFLFFSICWSGRLWGFHAEVHGSHSIQHLLREHCGGSQVLHSPPGRLPHLPRRRHRGPAMARARLWPQHHCHVVLVHWPGNEGALHRANTQLHAPGWSSSVMQSWPTELAVISRLVTDFSVPGF